MRSFNTELNRLELKDIIDLTFLQKFQDDFAKSMNIASVTVDKNGIPVTKPSSYTNICSNLTQSTALGKSRCAECHSKAGEEAFRSGKPYIYKCHSGLIDFAAPITVQGVLIGTILGGQILFDNPKEAEFKSTANELGLDQYTYYNAAKDIKIIDESNVKAAAEESSGETSNSIASLVEKIQASVDRTIQASNTTLDITEQQSAAIEETNASVEEVTSFTMELDKLSNSR